MENSLFQKDAPVSAPPNPLKLIESEIGHLKKGSSIRHGPHAQSKKIPALIVIVLCGLVWLYVMDPVLHAWYKGDAVRTYLYLHNYGAGSRARDLVATQIFSPDEVRMLDRRTGSFQDYFTSPLEANEKADTIIKYMRGVELLHAGKYQQLDPVGRLRFFLFVRIGLIPPTAWTFLDPSVGSE